MSLAKELIMKKFIAPYLSKKETNYIGVELEYPIIFKDSNINAKALILELFAFLKEKHNFKDEELDLDGNVASVKNTAGDKISLDYRYETLEFAMQKDLNLNNIADRFFKIFKVVQQFLKEHNCFLTGMGTNFSCNADQVTEVNTAFWNICYNYQKKFTKYKKINALQATCSLFKLTLTFHHQVMDNHY